MAMQRFGRFQIQRYIGGGAYAEVYEVFDPQAPGRPSALKILRKEYCEGPGVETTIERFNREAETIQGLDHRGLVKGREHGQEEGRFYMLMDLAPGLTLARRLEETRRFSWRDAIRMTGALADALDYLHRHNVIHRDLKPSNIVIDDSLNPVITDLGLALLEKLPRLSYSKAAVVGTVYYAAPENWNSSSDAVLQANRSTDVYSLGCILYEMIMGSRLFNVDNESQALYEHTIRGARLPNRWPADAPEHLREVLAYAVNRNMAFRYESAGKFLYALQQLPQRVIQPGRQPTTPLRRVERAWLGYTAVRQVRQIQYQNNALWAATSGGVLVYSSGSERVWVYGVVNGLPSHDVRALAFEPGGERVWAATAEGLAYLRDLHKSWTAVTAADGLPSDDTRDVLAGPDGSIWCATQKGVGRLQFGRWTAFTAAEGQAGFDAHKLIVGPDRQIWAGTASGMVRFDGRSWVRPPNDASHGMLIRRLLVDARDGLWGGGSSGLLRLTITHSQRLTMANGLPSNEILDLAVGSYGAVLAATPAGLVRIREAGVEKQALAPVNGRPLTRIDALAPAPDGRLYLATPDRLHVFENGRLMPIEKEFGLIDNNVLAVCQDSRGSVWFGSEKGLSFYDYWGSGAKWRIFDEKSGVRGPIGAIAETLEGRIGALWFGSRGNGLYLFDSDAPSPWERFTQEMHCLPSNTVTCLLATSRYGLWVGTTNGLAIFDGGRWRLIRSWDGLCGEHVLCLAEDPFGGGVWCGVHGGGACYWSHDDRRWRSYGRKDGLLGSTINGIAVSPSDGSVWFAADTGVFVRRPGEQISVEARVKGLKLLCALADRRGAIWFGTDRGALCLEDNVAARLYTPRDGLAGRRVNSISEYVDRAARIGSTAQLEQRLWFATQAGASSLE